MDSLQRLFYYKNVLYKFKALAFGKVYFDNIGDAVGVPATQVRKDFTEFGLSYGKGKRGGNPVDELLEKIQQ